MRRLIVLGLALSVLSTGCIAPSRSRADYENKAANSAAATISAIETARVAVEVASDGRAPGPYISLILSEAEETVSSVESSFAIVQPPDPALDALRTDVLNSIGETLDVLGELRVAARRDHLERLADLARDLQAPLHELRRFMELRPT